MHGKNNMIFSYIVVQTVYLNKGAFVISMIFFLSKMDAIVGIKVCASWML
jgi:hypothetical protein